MNLPFSIAWIYWNPSSEAFTLPFLEVSIYWYGIFFVSGFILGYFLTAKLLAQKICSDGNISKRDIINWEKLLEQLPGQEAIFKKIPKPLLETKGSPELRDTIVSALQESGKTRSQLEIDFPGSISSSEETGYYIADRFSWFLVFGTLIGARLGEVFFYEWNYYQENLFRIFETRKGGLSSHGAGIGIILSVIIFQWIIRKQYPKLTLIKLFDTLAIPTALAASFIRVGNFFNQEILGTPSSMPWAILFGNPRDGSPIVPRHPVQLYEAFAYFAIFAGLFVLWKIKKGGLRDGVLIGLLFITVFSARIVLEMFKAPQTTFLYQQPFWQIGQTLSIPYIIFGLILLFYSRWSVKFWPKQA